MMTETLYWGVFLLIDVKCNAFYNLLYAVTSSFGLAEKFTK